ncbi:uncharacterized protein LOC143289686 [Babylonia areolata]|uniref:uncharacterized protein LOC143289686 n=1 Tax=Babylonia areolata TaxID=304850 RepID=UPI003FD1BCA3
MSSTLECQMSRGEQDDGKELFMSTLPNTLEALCSMQAAPHDDTILHHLLDIIKELIISEADAKRCGLFDFVDMVREKAHGLNSATLVLAMGVSAHLAHITGGAGPLWQKVAALYDEVQSSVVSGCSSVGAAYFSSLSKVVACPAGLLWLENNNVHFQTALLTLEKGQSMFVLSAAENFVLTSLTNSLEANIPTETHSPPLSSMVVQGVDFLTSRVMEMKRNRATLLDQMIVSSHVSTFYRLVATMVAALSGLGRFCQWKVGDEAFVATLAQLALQHPSEKVQSSALQSVVNLVGYMSGSTKEEFLKQEIVSPLLKTMSEGGVESGIHVAAAFMKASQTTEGSEAMRALQKLVHLPHDLLFGQQIHNAELARLVSAVTTALCDQQRFGRLISSLLHSVKQTDNGEGLVRLVVSAGTTREDEDWPSLVSSWPQGVGAVIVSNRRLLTSLLDLFQQDDCLDLTMQQAADVLMTLMRIMRGPLVESRLYSQTCTAFLNIVSKQYQCSAPGETGGLEKVLTHWVELMEYRLVSMQWEIRDTTLELIRKVLGIASDPWFLSALADHHLLRHVWNCTKYGESYPRASAIALATSLTESPLWDAFLQDADITETTLANEMMEVVANDSEAFPRRAAVLLLTALLSRSTLPSLTPSPSDRTLLRTKICAAMLAAMNDFDWDVKVKVLDFWEKLAAPLLPCREGVEGGSGGGGNVRNAAMSDRKLHRKRTSSKQSCSVSSKDYHCALESLLQEGFGQALMTGAEDYDLAVKQKALHMLVSLQECMESEEDLPVKAPRLDRESDTTNSHSAEVTGEEASNTDLTAPCVTVNQFLQALSQLDPASTLQQQSHGANEYDRKPASVLEDVMAAVKGASSVHEVTFMSEDEFDDADDMFVDCY